MLRIFHATGGGVVVSVFDVDVVIVVVVGGGCCCCVAGAVVVAADSIAINVLRVLVFCVFPFCAVDTSSSLLLLLLHVWLFDVAVCWCCCRCMLLFHPRCLSCGMTRLSFAWNSWCIVVVFCEWSLLFSITA